MPEVLIQAHGVWKSDACKAYFAFAEAHGLKASAQTFEHIDKGQQVPKYPAIDLAQRVVPPSERELVEAADIPSLDGLMSVDASRVLLLME